jgi:hypothetical protein
MGELYTTFGNLNDIKPIDIIEEFQLNDYLKIVLVENSSNYAPYHNLNHILCMVKYAYVIGKSEELSSEEIKLLIISALFHDFNHSQGKEEDSVNIEIANKAVREYVDSELVDDVIDIIKATQYPYTIEYGNLTTLQKVIRDCDFMQTFEPNYIHQVLFGISKEIGISVKEFLPLQIKFLDSIVFNTKTGEMIGKDKIPLLKKDIVHIQNLI